MDNSVGPVATQVASINNSSKSSFGANAMSNVEAAANGLSSSKTAANEMHSVKADASALPNLKVATNGFSKLNLKDEHKEKDAGPSESDRERFNQLVSQAKKFVAAGRIQEGLKLNQEALTIVYHEKLAKKVKKMEDYLAAHGDDSESSEEEDSGMMHLGKGFYMYKELNKRLYNHQQEGVLWLWNLYRRKKGGILGDDMGLGKTIQVIGFLSGMFDMQKIHSVLIVLPVALMVNWEKEIERWAPGLKVVAFHGSSKREKERALSRVQRRGGICLTTYGLVITSYRQLGTRDDGRKFIWDYMILDEGHKIKNPTKTSKGVHNIPAKNRIILTGTPVQNNLKELWALFDFVHQGSLLGTQRTFRMEYDNPITRAREKDATIGEKKLGMEMAESLKKIIAPYFLRRTKVEVDARERSHAEKGKHEEGPEKNFTIMPTMMRKNDLIVWTFLTKTQLKIYQDFLSLDSVKELLMTTKSPLVALNVLKKICDHPRLLSTRACVQLGIDGDDGFDEDMLETEAGNLCAVTQIFTLITASWFARLDEDMLETEAGNLCAVTRIQHIEDRTLVREAGKLEFLTQLLAQLRNEGHRSLLFSQSRKMLDIMEKVLKNGGHKLMRLDGTITSVQERESRIRKFQTDGSYSVFLLTTQVGGVGLTLTAADRVIIYDPSWNPATDAQAVDRVFRIGQDKNVVIYRLITCGTVEEKIYRRQVFKDSITKQTTGQSKNPYRYFSKYELKELFTLDDPHTSTTQQQLESMHGSQRRTDTHLDRHIAYLYSLKMYGISDHDLMFGGQGGDEQDNEAEKDATQPPPETDYIQHRVQKAQQLIQLESKQSTSRDERLGKSQPGGTTWGGGRAASSDGTGKAWDFPKPEGGTWRSPERLPSSPLASRPEQVDLTSPQHGTAFSEECAETDEGSSVVSGDYSMDHSATESSHDVKHKIKQAFVDLTSPRPAGRSFSSIKNEPMDSSFVKEQEPDGWPPIKEETMDLTSTPYGDNVQAASSDVSMSGDIFQHRQPSTSISANLFGAMASPDVVETSRSLDMISVGSRSSLMSGQSESHIVEDSPNASARNRTGPHKAESSLNESQASGGMIEDSIVINDSVIVSDEEAEKSSYDAIQIMELRSILEKSLMSNAEYDDASGSNDDDSPAVSRGKRRSVCARQVVMSSDEEDVAEGGRYDKQENGDLANDPEESEGPDGDVEDDDDEENGGSEIDNNYKQDENDDDDGDDDGEGDDGLDVDRNSFHEIGGRASCIAYDYDERHEVEMRKIREENGRLHADDDQPTKRRRSGLEPDDPGDMNGDMDGDGSDDGEEYSGDEYDDEEAEGGFDGLPQEEQIRYNELVEAGRLYCSSRQYEEAQVCVLQALEIFPDDELQATAVSIQKKVLKHQRRQQQQQH